jgi:hypothetical protein
MNKDNKKSVKIAVHEDDKFMEYCLDMTCNTGYAECLECVSCYSEWLKSKLRLISKNESDLCTENSGLKFSISTLKTKLAENKKALKLQADRIKDYEKKKSDDIDVVGELLSAVPIDKDNKESVQIAVEKELRYIKNRMPCIGCKRECKECNYFKMYESSKKIKELQADRIKELESLDMVKEFSYKDKIKKLESEYDNIEAENNNQKQTIKNYHNQINSLTVEKTDILDKVKEVILNWHKDYTDTIQIDELIKEIDKLRKV